MQVEHGLAWPTKSVCETQLKVCVLDLVQLEDNIGYIKSSHTDLSSSNLTRSKTQSMIVHDSP